MTNTLSIAGTPYRLPLLDPLSSGSPPGHNGRGQGEEAEEDEADAAHGFGKLAGGDESARRRVTGLVPKPPSS
jgi:hypothetical protein